MRHKELARQQEQRDEADHRQERKLEKKNNLPPLKSEVPVRGELRLEPQARDYGALWRP